MLAIVLASFCVGVPQPEGRLESQRTSETRAEPGSQFEYVLRPVVGVLGANQGASGAAVLQTLGLTTRLAPHLGLRIDAGLGVLPDNGLRGTTAVSGYGHAYLGYDGKFFGVGAGLGFVDEQRTVQESEVLLSPAYALRLGKVNGLRLEARLQTKIDEGYELSGFGLFVRAPFAPRWQFDFDAFGYAGFGTTEVGLRYRFLVLDDLSLTFIGHGGVSGMLPVTTTSGAPEPIEGNGLIGPSVGLGIGVDF